MKTTTRLAIAGASALLCAAGIVVATATRDRDDNDGFVIGSTDAIAATDGYQFAVSRTPKLTFQQLETIIRKDPMAKQQGGKIEFGKIRMDQGTALAEVMFVSNDGHVLPFLYKLSPQRNSWKIVNVQRIWYVPRSHLLRGIRA